MLFLPNTYILAHTPVEKPDLSIPTQIAPAYFGPNAFPVPDMLDGTTSARWSIELYSDHYIGVIPQLQTEYTTDIFFRLRMPLFTHRANLVVFGNIFEYFNTPQSVNAYRRVSYNRNTTGTLTGDFYVSTDFMIFTQEKNHINLTIRAALKSASGGMYEYARYYDNAGYYFDATLGRAFYRPQSTIIKVALSTGFLCWQTDNGRQNDAVMYGVKTILDIKKFSFSAEYGGYVGWEKDGDAPMTLKLDVAYRIKDFSINAGYQAGLMDYPFHRARIGATYYFDIKTK